MASSSLVLPSLSPKSLLLSKPTKPPPSSIFFPSVSLKSSTTPISLASAFLPERRYSTSASRFVRNVAVSSEFGQEEEVSGRRGDDNFSKELRIFVGNLPFTVDSAELCGLFERAGNVLKVEVIYDKDTGRSRGFGFVTMSTMEEVEAATQQFNGYELGGRAIRVNYGPPPPRDEFAARAPRGGGSSDSSNRCYVGNLSWTVDDEALGNLFSEQGEVVEARVVYDRDSGRSKGFGFVTYSSFEEVENAISSLNGVDLNGREIRVSVAEARQRRTF